MAETVPPPVSSILNILRSQWRQVVCSGTAAQPQLRFSENARFSLKGPGCLVLSQPLQGGGGPCSQDAGVGIAFS